MGSERVRRPLEPFVSSQATDCGEEIRNMHRSTSIVKKPMLGKK